MGEQLRKWEVLSLELCYKIEEIGASTEQTAASIRAADLRQDIAQAAVEWDRLHNDAFAKHHTDNIALCVKTVCQDGLESEK